MTNDGQCKAKNARMTAGLSRHPLCFVHHALCIVCHALCIAISALPFMVLALPPDFTEDFSSGHIDGWSGMGGGVCEFAPNGGRMDNAGAVARGGVKGCGLSRRFEARPGSYEFVYWTKPVEVRGEIGVRGGVEFFDADGKFIHPYFYASPQGEPDDSGWYKVVVRVPRVPEAAAQIGVFVQVAPGSSGTAWFDDISLKAAVSPPLAVMACPRNQTASPGDTARVRIVRENGEPLCARQGALVRLRVGAEAEARSIPLVQDAFEFVVPDLPDGPCPLQIALEGTVDGGENTTLTLPMNVMRRQRRTTFDALGRMFVDGKPFMPLGFYSNGAGKRERTCLGECGANLLLPYNSFGGLGRTMDEIRKSLAELDAIGVKTVFSLSAVYPGIRWSRTEFDGVKGCEAVVSNAVTALRDEPGLLGWYLNDELPFSKMVADRRDLVSSLDADHPTFAEVYPAETAPAFRRTSDIFGAPCYPIMDKPPDETKLSFQALDRFFASFGADETPIWAIPQAHNLAVYGKAGCRAPTSGEMRTISLAQACLGSKGFVFYALSDLWSAKNGHDGEAEFSRRWPDVCALFRFLRDFEPWIMSAVPPERLDSPEFAPVFGDVRAWRFRDDAGRCRVVVVAAGPGRSEARLHLQGAWRSLFGRTTGGNDGEFEFTGSGISSDVLEPGRNE